MPVLMQTGLGDTNVPHFAGMHHARALGLPLAKPIFKVRYTVKGERRYINLFPTVQFLYSHHIMAEYISSEVRELAAEIETSSAPRVREQFLRTVDDIAQADVTKGLGGGGTSGGGSSSWSSGRCVRRGQLQSWG
jgi:hypothetical protein